MELTIEHNNSEYFVNVSFFERSSKYDADMRERRVRSMTICDDSGTRINSVHPDYEALYEEVERILIEGSQ